jgi:RNA 2',3'-cyclic 3'-phosphodiesterase
VTRAFVAVVPPESVLDAIERATGELDLSGARRTTRAQWHLTLQFLGDVADLDGVATALASLSVPSGSVRLGRAGAFPKARRAQVLWVGPVAGGELLATLAGGVATLLAPLGFAAEDRRFHPHLTLARTKAATDLRATVARLDACDFGPAWTVSDVVLYESRLLRTGAEYLARAVVRLPT